MKNPGLLASLIIFRIINANSIKTFFQPDEYWQSLEPAHKLVYGYGWLTWEWREHLRSAAHPLLFAAVYKICVYLSIDPLLGPKIFQACIAALGDFYTYKLGSTLLGSKGGQWALLASIFSAFNWYVSTRTFSNSIEMSLTAIALSYWPWNLNTKTPMRNLALSLSIASLACVFRPTNALLWGYLGLRLAVQNPKDLGKIFALALFIAASSLGINLIVDYLYYGQLVFPLAKFISFNVFQSLSHFYGVSDFHYYFSQGLPILLIAYLPLTIMELYKSRRSGLVHLVMFMVLSYSVLGHKEVRFIYPVLPVLHVIFAKSIMNLPSRKTIFLILLAINIPTALFFSLIHQRGVISVVDHIRRDTNISSFGFLMPCHSTPWQSHIHRFDLNIWFLTCEPPLGLDVDERKEYLDEADIFYADPVKFLDDHMGVDRDWPSHLAVFDALTPIVFEKIAAEGYVEDIRFFNSYFHDDSRRFGDVVVFKKAK